MIPKPFRDDGCVMYWMQAAQRSDDNPALNKAIRRANAIGAPVVVYFGFDSAFATAVYLNDKYELDGRDSNGYAGVAWSIGGRHDWPWPQRPIFGAIRYMSTEATQRKMGISMAGIQGKESRERISSQQVLPLNDEC